MATLTKTYTENQESSYKSTWTLTITGTNVTASGSTVSVPSPTISAKYVNSNKNKAEAYLYSCYFYANGSTFGLDGQYGVMDWELFPSSSSWASNTVKTLTRVGASAVSVNTSVLFNANNSTSKTVDVYFRKASYGDLVLTSFYNDEDTRWNRYETTAWIEFGAVSTVTLNAPPTCVATTTSSGLYYADISTYSVNISSLTAYYGGTVSSVVLNVGGKTASRTTNGFLSVVVPSASGNYTPTVTVTDSRGQTKAYSLTAITVQPHTLPTLTPTVTSSAPYYNIGTTYSVSVSDITAYEGASVSSIALKLGSQEDAKTSSFTDQFEINPNTVGNFTPQIVITDSYGATNTYPLTAIDVLRYDVPSVSFNVIRTDANGVKNDEGESAVITATFIWTSAVSHLTAPTVRVKDLDEIPQASTITWYESWTSSGGVSNAISDWSSVSSMPVYALVKNTTTPIPDLFNLNKSYYVSVTPNDNIPSTGTTVTQTLGSAFYTVDFRAGGHGISFGQPALQDGFFCNMEAHFVDKADVMRALFDFVYPVGSYYETSDTSFNPNVTWGGTWQLEAEGQVHISAGANYAVSGALTDTTDGGATTSATGNHTLTTTEIPAHTHNSKSLSGTFTSRRWGASGNLIVSGSGIVSVTSSGSGYYAAASTTTGSQYHTVTINATHTHDSVGGSGSHNHGSVSTMQPYIIVNRWHRTA